MSLEKVFGDRKLAEHQWLKNEGKQTQKGESMKSGSQARQTNPKRLRQKNGQGKVKNTSRKQVNRQAK